MQGLFLLAILGVDWASGYAIAGYCMTHGVSPYGYAFWQSFGPFALLLIIQVVRKDLWLDKKGIMYSFLCGFFGIVLPNLLIYFAASHIPSGLLTVLANVSPIFTYVLAVAFKDEGFSWVRFAVVVLGMVGVGFIIIPNQDLDILNVHHDWFLLALLIPLSYAFSAVYISRFHPGKGNVLAYAMWMLMFATLFTSPLAVINNAYYPLRIHDMSSWLIIGEILLSTLGYVLLFIILKMFGAVYYTLVNAIAVIAGVCYGVLLFGQSYVFWVFIGIMIVFLSIAALTYLQYKVRSS